MHTKIKQLVALSHDIAESYNLETDDFNALMDELDAARTRIAELEAAKPPSADPAELNAARERIATLEQDNAILETQVADATVLLQNGKQEMEQAMVAIGTQRDDMERLVQRRNSEITTYNKVIDDMEKTNKHQGNVIRALESQVDKVVAELADLKVQNKDYKRLNPKKLAETNKTQKVTLAEKQSVINRLEGKTRNLNRDNDRLRAQLEAQKIGEFRLGKERVIPYLSDELISKKRDLYVDRNFACARWWMHETGLQLLIAYDSARDELLISDPTDDKGTLHAPSHTVSKYLLEELRKEAKADKRKAG